MSSDTTAAARLVQTDVLRAMTGEQRLLAALEMCDAAREISRAGIRSRHPEYAADEVEHALHRLLVGDELADRVWPAHRHLAP